MLYCYYVAYGVPYYYYNTSAMLCTYISWQVQSKLNERRSMRNRTLNTAFAFMEDMDKECEVLHRCCCC